MAAEGNPRLQVLAAAMLFSTGGAAIKASTLGGFSIASFRSAVACLVVLAILPQSRERWTPRTWAVGAAYGATMVLFVVANKLTTAANTIFLQYTSPIYVMIAGPLLLEEPVRPRDVVFFAIVLGALALFFVDAPPSAATAPRPFLGNALALLSGVCWAATALGLRWMAKPEAPPRGADRDQRERQRGEPDSGGAPVETAVACGNLVAFAACLPFALPVVGTAPRDAAIILYLGVFQIAGAYYFLAAGLRALSAIEASLLLLLEPVLNPVWAWLVHGEQPGAWALCSGAIILAATTLKTWSDSRKIHTPMTLRDSSSHNPR